EAASEMPDSDQRNEREKDEQHEDVQNTLRDERAENKPLARLRACGEQVNANEIAAPRWEHVVPHVADGEQPVGVTARDVDLIPLEQCLPALAANGCRHSIRNYGSQQLKHRSQRPRDRGSML